ncbi:MAG: hypothetical protein AAF431_14875 [Pseudomonadota bacterium]
MKDSPRSSAGDNDQSLDEQPTESASNSDQGVEQAQGRPLVHAPRPVWMELLLGLLTFSVSFSFWLVGRARDVKNMRSADYTPWLWFFVPGVLFAQPFAFSKLFSDLKDLEGESTSRFWLYWGGAWIGLLMLANLVGTLAELEYMPVWTLFISVPFICCLFTYLHMRFNAFKQNTAEQWEFYGKNAGYYWWEWMLLVFALLFWALVMFAEWDDRQSVVKSLPNSYLHLSEEAGYQLQLDGEDWRQVEIGTYSDGSADVEFANASLTSYILVFRHGLDDTLNSIASFRFQNVQLDFDSTPQCSENRRLSADGKSVRSNSVCFLESRNQGEISVSTLVKVGDVYYELFSFGADTKRAYSDIKTTLLAAAESFVALPAGEAQ